MEMRHEEKGNERGEQRGGRERDGGRETKTAEGEKGRKDALIGRQKTLEGKNNRRCGERRKRKEGK